MQIRTVNIHQADELCPVCKKGWMRPTGIVPLPGMYEHKCSVCEYKNTYNVRYPYTLQG